MQSFLIIDALYAIANARQYLVRYRFEGITQDRDGQMWAKNFHTIALLAGNVGDVDHTNVHTNIAYVIGLAPIDQAVGMPITQMAIQSVGIPDRDSSDAGITLEEALPTIADGLAGLHIADLENAKLFLIALKW